MTKKRSEYVYNLVGIIKEKKKAKVKRVGYDLSVKLTNFDDINNIKAWKDQLTNQLWTDLENKEYINKKYLFYCHNYFGKYHLINWKELGTNGSDFNKSRQL